MVSCGDDDPVSNPNEQNEGNGENSGGNAPSGVVAIDLGLPSGTLWANMNLGATSTSDYGKYYAWGETAPKSTYERENYKWYDGSESCTKYNPSDSKKVLDKADDAAYVNWGKKWCMPTEAQFEELLLQCSCSWTTTNGIYGLKVTGNNGNSIFLPASGFCGYMYNANGDEFYQSQIDYGTEGNYWAKDLYTADRQCAVVFGFSKPYGNGTGWRLRCNGLTIRPVQSK